MPLSPIAFWFLRHGETDWNAQNLSQGNIDIPLNETGYTQARAAAKLLSGQGIASIVTSPLSRAGETARIVGETLRIHPIVQPDLHEVSFGAQEGQPMADWFADWVDGKTTPQGAESFAALRTRATTAINQALTHPATVLVVAHGALFRALRAEMGINPHYRTPNGVPTWCQPPAVPGQAWSLRVLGE
jgi:probable phosphoglycerate mutase